ASPVRVAWTCATRSPTSRCPPSYCTATSTRSSTAPSAAWSPVCCLRPGSNCSPESATCFRWKPRKRSPPQSLRLTEAPRQIASHHPVRRAWERPSETPEPPMLGYLPAFLGKQRALSAPDDRQPPHNGSPVRVFPMTTLLPLQSNPLST